MKIALITNDKASEGCALVSRVYDALQSLGAQVMLPPVDLAFPGNVSEELLQQCDAVVAIGGDGTIIHTAKRAARWNRPVLGINGGRLGFMAGLEGDELAQLSALIHGEYTIEQRMMLDVTVSSDRGETTRFCALNEAVVTRDALSHMVDLEVSSDREQVLTYRADGLIISTPTGSTAYSLSAGGPVIDPAVRCLLMTPVCAHSLQARSFIFSENARLTVRTKNADNDLVVLTVDGEDGVKIGAQDTVIITRSDMNAQLIKIKQTPFYTILNQKLMNRR